MANYQVLNVKDLKALRNDDVFVTNDIVDFKTLVGMDARKGFEQAVIVGTGAKKQIVNIVSNSYQHLPNENFFLNVEMALDAAGVEYVKRSINRDNRSFAVDYILTDAGEQMTVNANGKDGLLPLLRFTNSYDGSGKTTGSFAIFRKVCSNGLHICEHSSINGFSVKHSGKIATVVLPSIDKLVQDFLSNEFYTMNKQLNKLAETKIEDVNEFVKQLATETKLFKYEASDSNPLPSLNARTVIDMIRDEAQILNEQPNLWLGFNAFNHLLHNKLNKTFDKQQEFDAKLYQSVLEMAN